MRLLRELCGIVTGSAAVRRRRRAALRHARRMAACLMGPVCVAAGLAVPPLVAVAGAVAVTAAAPAAAKAAGPCSGSVLVFPDSVNGGASSAEATEAAALGCSVTMFSSSAVSGMTQAQMEAYFGGFTAIVIGDPSTSATCSSTVPADALQYAADWGPAVKGNVAVLGTAPVLAGSAGQQLLDDAITYAVTGGASGNTGLYASLDCDYSAQPAGTAVPLLASVGGGGFTVTGQGGNCPGDAGTPNRLQVISDAQFNGLTASNLGPWSSPACSVQETLTSWTAGLSGLAYDSAATPATFTASNGATGQAYVVAGTLPTAGTLALAPSQGGEVPAGTTAGGDNPADPGVTQATAGDPVNTENGDFTQSNTDLSIPTFGPSLTFTRTYDADVAQQQTQTGSPGAMGYGWTDDWASSLTPGRPVQGNIYTLAGLRSDNGTGGPPASAALGDPSGIVDNGGNTYIVDTQDNQVLEVAGSTGTQWGQPMTAGDTYVVISPTMQAQGSALAHPVAVAFDSAGDMYVDDSWHSRILELPVASKTQWGLSLTAGTLTTIAGCLCDISGSSGDGGLASKAYLYAPRGIAFDSAGDLYISDTANSRIQEVAAAGGKQWGVTMTASDVYTIAGTAGTAGMSGDGSAASGALLNNPAGITVDSSGDVIFADSGNNRVQEIVKTASAQWGPSMAANDIYTIAGSATGTAGTTGDGGAAVSGLLDGPEDVTWSSPNVFVADSLNNRVQEIAGSGHTQFGQPMTLGDIYTVAGSAVGTPGFSGDGGAATSAELNNPLAVTLDGSANLYIADADNNRVREVSASAADISTYAGAGYTLATTGDGGPATQAGLNDPMQEAFDSRGDVYIADAANNRIQEIASYSHTQYGITMTAGDVYTIAGQADGQAGCSCDGIPSTQTYLNDPMGMTIDASGDLFIADTSNNRIQEVPNENGVQWGQNMTTGYMYTIAGNANGAAGYSGDAGPAGSALLDDPRGLVMDAAGDIFIADSWNSRIQEIYAAGGQNWGNGGWVAGDIYTVAGNVTGTNGNTGDGGPATSALLYGPGGIAIDTAGNLYIGDGGNNRVQEVAAVTHTQWGQSMTGGDMYTVAGGVWGSAGDGGPAIDSTLDGPDSVAVDPSGDVYFTDNLNNRVQEIANANGTQWGQSMTTGDLYTVAGSATGASGNAGDGGPATSALMATTMSVSLDPEGDLYITDNANDTIREVASAIPAAIPPAPGQTSSLALAPSGNAPGGLTITQPGGAQVTFWAQSGGSCAAQYVATGSYCILPQDQGATLSYNSSTQVYTFSPAPGQISYTYNAAGDLTSETDTAGNTLTITYNSPSPGGTVTGNGTCPSAAASCQTITSASGRALVLGYSGTADSGHITSATDPMNRTWTYGYTGAQLTSATDPMTNKTTYTYGAGSSGNPLLASDLLTITSPNAQPGGPDAGDATVNVYDGLGRVITQTDPMGFKTTFNYCVSAAAGNCIDAATGTGYVTVADPDGNSTVYDYQQGTLTAQTSYTGTTLASEQDNTPDVTAGGSSGGTLLDTTSTDGDGDTTSYTYDTSGDATSTTAPDGVGSQTGTTTSQYTSLGASSCASTAEASTPCSASETGPSPVAPGGVITPSSSSPPAGETWTLYDTDGNELYTTIGVYEPGNSSASYQRTTYQMFKGNSITLNGTKITCTNTPPAPSLPCATINADGVVTQLSYDSHGDLTASSLPDGNGSEVAETTYEYDSDGEQTNETTPDGNLSGANAGNYTTVTAWNADAEKTSVAQADGPGATATPRITYYGYDTDGNQATVKDARGYTTTTAYNADDKPTLVTNPDGDSTLTCYDGDGNTAQTVPAVGVAGNSLTAASCPTSYPSSYTDRLASDATVTAFDALGKQTQQTSPAPAGQSGYETTSYSYDGGGNLLTTTAPATSNGGSSEVTTDTYNTAGQIAAQTTGYGTPAASTISYCYDPNGDKTAVVYADGNANGPAVCETSSPWVVSSSSYPIQAAYQTTYSYDSERELVSTTTPVTSAAPSGAKTTSTYDAVGNLLTRSDPNGVTTTWTYTPLALTASVSYSGSSAHSVSYTYDPNGNNTEMTDATGTSSYVYDPFGELTSATNGAGQVTGYGYSADGKVSSITYPLPSTAAWATSDTVSYGYDNADLLTAVTDFNGHQIAINDTADGLPYSQTLGSTGDTITTNYDPTDSPSGINLKNSNSTLQSFTYSDAPAGDILSETDTPSSSLSPAGYTYDVQDRVTSMTPGTGPANDYGFDASSNLTTLPTGATGTYNDAGELISSSLSGATTDYSYNADGEQLKATQGSVTLASGTWNGATQMTSYDNSAADMTTATYDGNAMRASSTIAPSGGTAVTQNYVWDTVPQVPQLIMDSANAYIYGTGLAPAEQVSLAAGTIKYLVTDSLGSVRGTVSSSGALTGTTSYDAWGNPETADGLAATTPFGYAGGYTDPDGLIYFINRYYDPATGQFISSDPDVDQTQQPYEYADGDPVLDTDPSGLCWFCLIDSVQWVHANGPRGINQLNVYPSTFARLLMAPAEDPFTWFLLNYWTLKDSWHDVVNMAGRRASTGTLYSQYVCHWFFVREIPGRAFHLQTWYPNDGIIGDIRHRCNP
jgi:RHS repeat-associated protein